MEPLGSCRVKILHVTPGTGNFYCGSCLRDAGLIRELRRRDHRVQCVPFYLPLVTEGDDPSSTPMFFGGINVTLQQRYRFFRTSPRWMDVLFDRPHLLRLAARIDPLTDAQELGELTLSMLRGEEGNQRKELERFVAWINHEPRPDIICLSNALLVGLGRVLKERIGVPVVCTLQGEDAFLDALPNPLAAKAWEIVSDQSQQIDGLIPVSQYYGNEFQRRTGIDPERFYTISNGVDLSGFSMRASLPNPPVIGFLAQMCPAKGLHRLIDAFVNIRKSGRAPEVGLRIAGACTPGDQGSVDRLKTRLHEAGYASDVSFHTNLTRREKTEFLRGLTVFSVPTLYNEAFGMYVIEALACGVPVVEPNHGAFPELIAACGGGVLYAPEESNGLEDALMDLLQAPERARALGSKGREQALEKYSIGRMADDVVDLFRKVI